MEEAVVGYVMLLAFGGSIYLAVVVRDSRGPRAVSIPRKGILSVVRGARISRSKGWIRPGGVIQVMGRTKKVKGRDKILVSYYGGSGEDEAEKGTEFWAAPLLLAQCTTVLVGATAPKTGTPARAPAKKDSVKRKPPRAAKGPSEDDTDIREALQSWRHAR